MSHNPNGEETIVLLHGLISGSLEYELVLPHIPSHYHVLVPDLPGHSASKRIPLTTLADLISIVSSFIKEHAHNGKAHLVGLSFGGHISLTIAAEQPDIVLSCWATGSSRPTQAWVMGAVPYLLPFYRVCMMIPGLVRLASPYPIPPNLEKAVLENLTYNNGKGGYGMLHYEWKRQVPAVRTLLCSGSREDNVQHMRDHREELKKKLEPGYELPTAYVAKGMGHVWSVQDPEAYAKSFVAWIEGTEFPDFMIKLEDWKD